MTILNQRRGFLLLTQIILAILFLTTGCRRPQSEGTIDIIQALSSDSLMDGYAVANRSISIKFPKDFGPHEGFKTEWWYYTGNLEDATGRHFGFQLTFFRQALDHRSPQGQSAWRTNQLYFAHFAVTDTQNNAFYSSQRMNRGSLGIAGAKSDPFQVWIDDWSATQTGVDPKHLTLKAMEKTPPKGETKTTTVRLNLNLIQDKPAILQGNQGWSRKGPGPSDASYYFSMPGMTAKGRVELDNKRFEVTGRVWFDHEWSTSALGKNVRGWDWFAFHLTRGVFAGTDLMVCQIRQADGTSNGFGFGSISFRDGSSKILNDTQFSIIPTAHWTSPETGKRYPARWDIKVPGHDMTFDVQPIIPDQEHPHGFSYYEGAVRVSGKKGSGSGYVEMTGYTP